VPVADDTTLIASSLDELIRTSRSSENGFEWAARLVEDLNLRHLFESYAQQRAEFAAALESEVGRRKNDCAIIIECERQEDRTAAAFRQALDTGLPEDLRQLVKRQLAQIEETLQQVRSLQQAHSRIQ
jgi:alkanesulfonate monooxygenase SsuD/methylene tetrahydromethanopterin reductase-like flavin-dependent oxidoreductase (luciferase family)